MKKVRTKEHAFVYTISFSEVIQAFWKLIPFPVVLHALTSKGKYNYTLLHTICISSGLERQCDHPLRLHAWSAKFAKREVPHEDFLTTQESH